MPYEEMVAIALRHPDSGDGVAYHELTTYLRPVQDLEKDLPPALARVMQIAENAAGWD